MDSSALPAAGPPIFVVDRHGDALQYWQQEHRPGDPPFAVLHIDSHADMHLDSDNDEWTGPREGWRPPPSGQVLEHLRAGVNITNFQTVAIYSRLVDAVVWLRSDFKWGSYNFPAPGHHRRLLGVPDYSRARCPRGSLWPSRYTSTLRQDRRPLIWDWELIDGSFHAYGPKQAHKNRRDVLAGQGSASTGPPSPLPEAPPVEENTLFEDRPQTLAFGLPPAEGTGVEFACSVLTRRQLEAGELGAVRRILRNGRQGRHWVLDIDLDYFSTSCPALDNVLGKHGWHSHECSTIFAAWATRLSGIVSGHLERECKEDLFSEACFQATAQVVFQLGQLPAARAGVLTAADILALLRHVHPACNPPADALSALASTVNGLTPAQRCQWEALDGEDWHWVMQSRCPHYHATVPEVRAEARRLGPLLAALGPGPPALVTIARSSDGYLPDDVASVAEWETLLLVRRIWPSSDVQGACKSLPAEAEGCSEDQVEAVRRSVHFHTVEATGRTLLPRPWPFTNEPRPFELAS